MTVSSFNFLNEESVDCLVVPGASIHMWVSLFLSLKAQVSKELHSTSHFWSVFMLYWQVHMFRLVSARRGE